jgi:hypothetical protein
MPIGREPSQNERSGNLDPKAEAQRDLMANPAIDPQDLLSEEADPLTVEANPETELQDEPEVGTESY